MFLSIFHGEVEDSIQRQLITMVEFEQAADGFSWDSKLGIN